MGRATPQRWTGRRWPTPSPRSAGALRGAAALLALVMQAHAGGTLTEHTIVIAGMKFEPASVTLRRGDAVVWVNQDLFPHTVTAAGAFDSHTIAVGHSWRYVARRAGQYRYTCTLHPNMEGLIQVQ